MKELFASDKFNFEQFLASNSEVPLPELISNLENVSKLVQNELYELINGDLIHFQNVLKGVCDIDIDKVKQFRAEFETKKFETEKIYSNFKEYFDEVNRKFQRLKYIRAKKESLIKIRKARQYIEVFKERQIKAEKSLYELEINVKNYSWLSSFCTELPGELVESESTSVIHKELSRYNDTLQEILELQLRKNLTRDFENVSDIILLISLCKEMNKMNLFDATFKLIIVYPSIEQDFKETNGQFELFLEKSFRFIKGLKPKLAELNLKSEFLIKSVIIPIINWITEKFSNIFVPNDMKTFKNNFEKGLEFVSKIEGQIFEYEDEVLLFRNQPEWINFMKKWALHQYYQFITNQVTVPFENCLRTQNVFISNDSQFKLDIFPPTLLLNDSLKYIWREEVILKPLIPKFLKMSLQLIRRFMHFCTEDDLFAYENPKLFLISKLQKHYNLKHLMDQTWLQEQLSHFIDTLSDGEGVSNQILSQLRCESERLLKNSRENMVPGIVRLYDQLFNREKIKSIHLDTLKILKSEVTNNEAHVGTDIIGTILQQVLLKFNRTIFRMIDEKGVDSKDFPDILRQMEEIEGETIELGYEKLIREEFWLEIRAALH